MADSEKLFAGEPSAFGGLSNEQELTGLCPAAFKKSNAWSDIASRLFFFGGKIGHWKWRSPDKDVRDHQFRCFNGLMGTFGIGHLDKEAVAGWMLSEMLTEVPEYIPQEVKS